MRRSRSRLAAAIAVVSAIAFIGAAPGRTLDLYFIDVEGGQSTLIVTPAGQTVLVDAGFAGAAGTFTSPPGDPHRARDAMRILAAARDAGVTRIDDLIVTHFHSDHDGGVPEVAKLIPIGTYVDHETVGRDAEETAPGTYAAFDAYGRTRGDAPHVVPVAGSRLPLTAVDLVFISSAGATLADPLPGAGAPNAACTSPEVPPQEPHENPRSTAFRLQFGSFRFLDVGDLTGPPLHALACPRDLVGPVDVYLAAHHGGPDAADPATLAAFRPRVTIVNNGAVKGGTRAGLAALAAQGGDVWQLHKSNSAGDANAPDERIANEDEIDGRWIKIAAQADGSFTVTNGRTGLTKTYGSGGTR